MKVSWTLIEALSTALTDAAKVIGFYGSTMEPSLPHTRYRPHKPLPPTVTRCMPRLEAKETELAAIQEQMVRLTR